ncbi:MAG: methyltransferase [Mycoplasmataceae bacterium]|nr:methyltransferase [Mycoplasmataceae bacterium]
MISKRLTTICNFIIGDHVLDIGTDHGLIPIFLLQNNLVNRVTATELNDGPLEIAKKSFKKNHLDEQINLIKADGFKTLNPDEFSTIIIAGMGGTLISQIINNDLYSGRYVLHPTNNFRKLRETLKTLKFTIIHEQLVVENKINNLIIVAEKTIKIQHLNEYNLVVGPKLKFDLSQEVTNLYKTSKDYYLDLYNKSSNKDYKKKSNYFEKVLKWRNKKS